MTTLVERIDALIEESSLLKHPFYQMWSGGKLTLAELGGYSKEYFQLVKQIPRFVENIKSKTSDKDISEKVSQNLKEESEHIIPWIQFARSLGIEKEKLQDYEGYSVTQNAVRELESVTNLSFEESVAAMYAYEKDLPRISRSKIEGLKKFYGLETHDATRYFEIHEVADIKHAELWRSILNSFPTEKEEIALSAAKRSLDAQNKLLDSVMERYCKAN